MLDFRDDLKARCGDLPFGEFDELHNAAIASRVDVSTPLEFSPVAKLPCKYRNALQAGLRRSLELSDGLVLTFNSELLVPTFVQSRAILETGSLMFDAYRRVQTVVEQNDTSGLADLDDFAMRMVLGTKSDAAGGDPDEYQAPSVLTILSRLAKREGETVQEVFEFLSEFCHPNFWGLVGAYTQIVSKDGTVEFVDRPFASHEADWPFAILGAVLGLSFCVSATEQFESGLGDFVALCEAHIHERGTWPESIPYPRLGPA